ncbi:methyltransferase domain-containing protein [Bradyrhizobium sp. CSA112]|uniref:class I SAM-dependent methyltransferase n=1 Tax=Bradyrhizobium sp. CSA112 TaxID=2699170 RepID=UPI0023AF076C|nr:class I SAM-dependent methyltransferase [Bradyrhizobium sp. CSA112]MDE5453011.1 methyltransferase domain-containing protein [Bradyrhizobium sp. CSA112]
MISAPVPKKDSASGVLFKTSAGYELPVEHHHRYRMVKGPTYIAELVWLYGLEQQGLLAPDDQAEFHRVVGTRTLAVPFEDACSWSVRLAEKYIAHLVPGSVEAGMPIIAPKDAKLKEQLAIFRNSNGTLLERFSACGGRVLPPGADVLEIGFTSGGHSIFALEGLGFQVSGIDNLYGGIADRAVLHTHLAKRLSSKAQFVFGDVTQQTPFEDASFDMIFSISVLEHVSDLPAAFREMRRLLKPDGFLLHRYNPFFAANGGHSWGELDCPWGHVRVSTADHLRYLEEQRPYEEACARPWVASAMNRSASLAQVQKWLVEAGFRPVLWEEHPEPVEEVCLLDGVAAIQALGQHPFIGLSDLLTREVVFAAVPATISAT